MCSFNTTTNVDDKLESLSNSPHFKAIKTPELIELARIFEQYSFDIRIAGGAVRDIILEKTPDDVDLATTATPDEMKDMFTKENIRMINARGESHGTITARIFDQTNFEVTTLRIDKVTDGRHAEVEFTTDWKLDANRRDLTINAMFLGLDGKLYDYFGGLADLRERVIRFVGDPTQRICEDYLRILRYFRFYGRFACHKNQHREEILKAIKENVKGLEKISGERLRMELVKILVGRFAPDIVETMAVCNVLGFCGLPDNPQLDRFRDVYDRTLSESNQCRLPSAICMALLISTAQEAEVLIRRLKLSRLECEMIRIMLMEGRSISEREDDLLFFQKRFLRDNNKLPKMKVILSEVMRAYGVDESNVSTFISWNPQKFPVRGQQLSSQWNVRGRELGRCMDALRALWIEGNMTASEENLLSDETRSKVFSDIFNKD